MEFTLACEAITCTELLNRLEEAGVETNTYADELFAMPAFDSLTAGEYRVWVVSVAELGLAEDEATFPSLYSRAQELGYELCPLELAPFFRLAWLDQPESSNSVLTGQKQAPEASVSVATAILSEDVSVPKGFYLRVVDGVPWLRGYRCDDTHVFEQSTMFAFVAPQN